MFPIYFCTPVYFIYKNKCIDWFSLLEHLLLRTIPFICTHALHTQFANTGLHVIDIYKHLNFFHLEIIISNNLERG